MISIEEVREKFKDVCVKDGRFIALIFGEEDKSQISTVKIFGKHDDFEPTFLIAADIGCVCLAVIERDKRQSAYLATLTQGNRRTLEIILYETIRLGHKLGQESAIK